MNYSFHRFNFQFSLKKFTHNIQVKKELYLVIQALSNRLCRDKTAGSQILILQIESLDVCHRKYISYFRNTN